MARLIIDIETIGFDFESFEKNTQEYLLKYAKNENEEDDVKKKLGLHPLTGEIVAIGMFNPDTEKGMILFQNNNEEKIEFIENKIVYRSGTEKSILDEFWKVADKYSQVITFNGRTFDIPFILLRSAKNCIYPTKNFLGYRYEFRNHCDLLDQLSFYGVMRKFNLDFYAKFFKIKSSKDEGIDGSMIGELYQSGKYLEIARYCTRDLLTTKELYSCWDKYLKF